MTQPEGTKQNNDSRIVNNYDCKTDPTKTGLTSSELLKLLLHSQSETNARPVDRQEEGFRYIYKVNEEGQIARR